MNKFRRILYRFSLGRLITWILAIAAALIAIFPIYWMFNIVFSPAGIPISISPRLYPTSILEGIKNIAAVLGENHVARSFLNSLVYCALTIVGSLLLSSLAAYEFALYEFPGKKYFFGIIMLALMIPTAVTLIPTYLLVAKIGWVNTMQGLVVPGIASAFSLFMMKQFLEDTPREIIDAALIDGASHFGAYWYVVMPLAKNVLVTLSILTFMMTWGNFIWPLVIARTTEIVTVSQMINWYNDPNSFATINSEMTAFLLAAALPIIVYVFFSRQIMQGVSISGLKG